MKKMKKVFAMVLTIAIVLSCGAAVASATHDETMRVMQAYGLTEQDFEVVYKDENIEILTASAPVGAMTRSGAYGTGTANPYGYPSYRCQARYGNCCRFEVANVDDTASMYVTFVYDDNNNELSYTSPRYTVEPGDREVMIIRNTNENIVGLTGRVEATVQAKGTANSVDYSYDASQYFDYNV